MSTLILNIQIGGYLQKTYEFATIEQFHAQVHLWTQGRAERVALRNLALLNQLCSIAENHFKNRNEIVKSGGTHEP